MGCQDGIIIPSKKLLPNGPHDGNCTIGWIIHIGKRDCSRLAKPKFHSKSCELMTSPTRKAIDSPHVTIWRPRNSDSGPHLCFHHASRAVYWLYRSPNPA